MTMSRFGTSLNSYSQGNLTNNTFVFSSDQLVNYLKSLQSDPNLAPHILDVRGRGLMIGMEFASPTGLSSNTLDVGINPDTPADIASRIAKKCIEKGMLILTTSVYQVIRFIPPLNVSEADMKKGCAIFEEALREVVREG